MSVPFKLYRLQQIDSQIDRVQARLQEIEVALGDDAVVRQAKLQEAEALRAQQEVEKSLKRAEGEVQAQRLKIEQTEASLYGGKIRNPKELQDLQQESAALKRYLTVLEDRQLDLMLELDEAEGNTQQAGAAFENLRTQTASQKQTLVAEQNNLINEVQRLEEDRQLVANSVPGEDLRQYEQLRPQRNGVAVARVTDRACSACGSILSATLYSVSRSPTQLTYCATCGRILYHGN